MFAMCADCDHPELSVNESCDCGCHTKPKTRPLTDVELAALTALVQRETAQFEASARQYGEMQFDPVTPASVALDTELRRRKVIQ